MATAASDKAKAGLRASMAINKPQVDVAEETLRLLRDGERLEKEMAVLGPPGKQRGRGMNNEQRIINALGAIVFAFFGWWGNNIWQTVQSMQSQVTNLNVELARNYAPRLELQAQFDRINNTLERIDRQTKGAR